MRFVTAIEEGVRKWSILSCSPLRQIVSLRIESSFFPPGGGILNPPGERMAFELIRRIYEEKIPFHRFLDLRLTEAAQGRATLELDFKQELVGNYRLQALHGGIIASLMDIVGSAAALSAFSEKDPPTSMGTVDLRTDYLRPARGRRFRATGEVIRPGRSLVVTRCELRNEKEELQAVGTATYRVSLRGGTQASSQPSPEGIVP